MQIRNHKSKIVLLLVAILAASARGAMLIGSTNGNADATKFYLVDGMTASATERIVSNICCSAGTLMSMTVWASAAPNGAGKSWTVTVNNNTVATAATVTISNADTTGSWSGSVDIAADDNLAINVDSASSPAAAVLWWAVTYTTDTPGQQWVSGAVTTLGTSGTVTFGPKTAASSQSNAWAVFPTAGTVSNFHFELNDTSGGTSRLFKLQESGSDPTPQPKRTIGAAGTGGADDVNTIDIVAGDYVRMACVNTGTPTARDCRWGFVFTPATSTYWALLACSQANMATDHDSYYGVSGNDPCNVTETVIYQKVPALKILNIYVALTGSPGTSKSYDYTLRVGQADSSPSLSCSVAGAATSANGTATVNVAAGSLLDTEVTPVGTPTARVTRGIGYTIDAGAGSKGPVMRYLKTLMGNQ